MKPAYNRTEWADIADVIAHFIDSQAYDAFQWYLADRVGHRHEKTFTTMKNDMTDTQLREALGERRANLAAAIALSELGLLAKQYSKKE